MEISADGNASIIGVRRTEVLIFNFQGSQKSLSFMPLYISLAMKLSFHNQLFFEIHQVCEFLQDRFVFLTDTLLSFTTVFSYFTL